MIARRLLLLSVEIITLATFAGSPVVAKAGRQREVLREGLNLQIPRNRFSFRFLRGNFIGDQILAGTWTPPEDGDTVELARGATGTWNTLHADEDGRFAGLRGYLYLRVESTADRVAILEANGHSLAYVNGQPRTAGLRLSWQPLGTGTPMPIELKAGVNHLVFLGGGIDFSAALITPESAATFSPVDMTLPDLVAGESQPVWASILVINATGKPITDLAIAAHAGGQAVQSDVPVIAPAAGRKAGFRIHPAAASEPGTREVTVKLLRGGQVLDTATCTLRVRGAGETRKRTFVSNVDGSVQYYAVNPATSAEGDDRPKALVLSLHGAGVEAGAQADSYSSKSWAHIVAPTNRRPYGFNWETIGRIDAMEVLADAQQRLGTDPQRTYLTGHSMGGHGTWHVGQTYPDRFAAIGPSAGWVRFGRYRRRGQQLPENPTPLDKLVYRPAYPTNTESLASNYAQQAVYILHGSVDDNVPPTHARRMHELLAPFHHDLTLFEQPGAGHWWDNSDAAGVDCVDWMPMFQLFSRRIVPTHREVNQVRFVTANPAVSSRCYWARIEDQVRKLEVSSIDLRWFPHLRRFAGTTENVARMSLDLNHATGGKPLSVFLDGQEFKEIQWPESKRLWFHRIDSNWTPVPSPSADLKGPHRYGPFSDLFRNRFMLVYGTAGTPEENAWSLTKARYDAEAFWVRGNGSVDIVADEDFDPSAAPDRNVVLYGSADTNSAWQALLQASPVQMHRGRLRIGEKVFEGEDLTCLFLRPRPGSDSATVGAVAVAGSAAMRSAYRLRYLQPAVDYPDCIVMGPGGDDVRGAGFFGTDWSVEGGEFAWKQREDGE